MPIQTVSLNDQESGLTIYSPFSGEPAIVPDKHEINEQDESLLFVFFGDVGHFVYVSPIVNRCLENGSDDEDTYSVEGVIQALGDVDGVNNGWNGVNYYAFGKF